MEASPNVIRFGVFQADLGARELYRNGIKVKLQGNPFQVLAMLLERPDQVVKREEFHEALWPDEAFGDLDLRLNQAVSRLRIALEDSATSPRWIETIPQVGYRFIGGIVPMETAPAAAPAAEPEPAPPPPRRNFWVAMGAVAILAAVAIWLWPGGEPDPFARIPTRRISFVEQPPLDQMLLMADRLGSGGPAISPDGAFLAYHANRRGGIWLKDLATQDARQLVEVVGASDTLAWSPDSKELAYSTPTGSLFAVSVQQGETSREICQDCDFNSGGCWTPDSAWIVTSRNQKLFRVPAAGGDPEPVFDLGRPGLIRSAVCLPGNLVAMSITETYSDWTMLGVDLDSGETWPLGEGFATGYSPTRHLIYAPMSGMDQLGQETWAMPLTQSGRRDGESFKVIERGLTPSVSAEGTMVYYEAPKRLQQFALRDREGNVLRMIGNPGGGMGNPVFSTDSAGVLANDLDSGDLWIHETDREVARRLPAPGQDAQNDWSWDGKRIAYNVALPAAGVFLRLHERTLEPLGESTPVSPEPDPDSPVPMELEPAYSPDSRFILYHRIRRAGGDERDLHYLERQSDGGFQDRVFLSTPFNERDARFSADGRYVVYASDETGRYEIHVREFPSGERSWQVSEGGGERPKWRRDGKEIVYLSLDPIDKELVAVPVQTKPSFSFGRPTTLFTYRLLKDNYDISADGELIVTKQDIGEDPSVHPPTVHLWQNWYGAFRDRVN